MDICVQAITTDFEKIDSRQIRLLRGIQGLHALEADWHKLETSLKDARFIHFYGWYKSYLENSESNPDSVLFILISDGDVPVALFPLRRTSQRRFCVSLRTWEIFWPNDMGVSDVIFEKTHANRAMLSLLIQTLRAHKDLAWDFLRLQDILVDSCAMYSLNAVPLPLSLTLPHHCSKYIRSDVDYETALNRMASKFRRNVRRQTKKINELGSIEYRFISEREDLEAAFNQFLEAEAASWKGGANAGSAILLHADQVNFYRTVLIEFSKIGACSINLILLDDHCISAQFCLTCGDTLYVLKIGYDQTYHSLGPGNVLFSELLRRCCADEKIRNISFITGTSWQDNWAPESSDVYECCIFNKTLPGVLVYQLEIIKNYARQIKQWLQRRREISSKPRHA